MSLSNYSKILSRSIFLNKHIEDDDILLITYYTTIIIFDRNDIIGNPVYLDPYKLKSTTIIKETSIYYKPDIISYKYLNGLNGSYLNLDKYRNEPLIFIRKYLENVNKISDNKTKMVILLRKENQEYFIDYYVNNNMIDKLLTNKIFKEKSMLIALLEYNETINIKKHIDLQLKDILYNTHDKLIENNLVQSPFNDDIILYEYQKQDILWMKNIEDAVLSKNNHIDVIIKPYYNIFNKYLIDHCYNINLNIDTLQNSYTSINKYTYFGGNIISEMGLGKTLIVLYYILINIPNKSKKFIKFSENCNYFYKSGKNKGISCNTPKKNHYMYCNKHSKSLFLDKKSTEYINLNKFHIKNFFNCNYTYIDKNGDSIKLLNTNATLILCPNHLCDQWIRELYDKTDINILKNLHILVINTYNQYTNVTISDILFADIVIVGYEFLINHNYNSLLHQIDFNKNNKQFLDSTLFSLHSFYWNRIVFDEFHEIKLKHGIFDKCTSFHSTFKWNMSGTPFANNVNGFIDSLKLNTNFEVIYKNNLSIYDYITYGFNTNLISQFKILFKRNTQHSIINHYWKNNITYNNNILEFTDQERIIYDAHLNGFQNKYSKFLIQLCCHPDLYSETKTLIKKCKTLKEIQDVLLESNKVKLNQTF